MRVLLLLLLLISTLLAACAAEIDTGKGPCSGMTGGLAASSAPNIGEVVCTPLCTAKKLEYKEWACSEKDTLLCRCE